MQRANALSMVRLLHNAGLVHDEAQSLTMRGHGLPDDGDRLRIVVVAADIDRHLRLRPGRQRMVDGGADHPSLPPSGDEHRDRAVQLGEEMPGFLVPGCDRFGDGCDMRRHRLAQPSAQPQPQIGEVDQQIVHGRQGEEHGREQQQFVMGARERLEQDVHQRGCAAGPFAKEATHMPTTQPKPSMFAPVRALFVGDAAAGILLIAVAAAAMLIANSNWAGAYQQLFHGTLPLTPIPKLDNLHLWVNDGLMAVFFFVVGMEVKRELMVGQLANAAQRRLPVLAAVAGMAVPAAVYLFFAGDEPALLRGWAIPAATDIAFAMGVLGLLGSRVPASLRLFLLTVAIVDDIGAVMVIALFYTANLKLAWLLAALAVLGGMMLLNRFHVSRLWPYLLLALVLWFCVLHSGMHATIAGVVSAFTIPMTGRGGGSLLETLEHRLAPWSAYLVVPVFGFANAGVDLSGFGVAGLLAPLPLAIAAGLVIGKQVGIFSAVLLADRTGFAKKPANASWPEIWGISILCGIGFTMSLFIGELAFPGSRELVDEAKIGILMGSAVSAVLGYAILRMTTRHPEEAHLPPG